MSVVRDCIGVTLSGVLYRLIVAYEFPSRSTGTRYTSIGSPFCNGLTMLVAMTVVGVGGTYSISGVIATHRYYIYYIYPND